jgi:hypothetical protein
MGARKEGRRQSRRATLPAQVNGILRACPVVARRNLKVDPLRYFPDGGEMFHMRFPLFFWQENTSLDSAIGRRANLAIRIVSVGQKLTPNLPTPIRSAALSPEC